MFYFSGDGRGDRRSLPGDAGQAGTTARCYTFPLAGTRPRGKTEEEDKALEQSCSHERPEGAGSEHNMLVDLGRNDIGKISQFGYGTGGNATCPSHALFPRDAHRFHRARRQFARIRDALDAVEAVLPAGTLSGAPKIPSLPDDRGIGEQQAGHLRRRDRLH